MKRTKRMMIVTLMATTAVAMLLMSKAFAAPAGTTTKTCPTKSILNQVSGANNITPDALQKLLNQNGITLPASMPAGTTASTCPKSQALQQLLSKYGFKMPANGTTTTPAPTPAPVPAPKPAPAPAPTTPPVTNPPATGSMSAQESKMINLVNQDRANNGLKPLTFDAGLRSAALLHSQDMSNNNYFSHTSPTYGTFSQRLKDSGVKYSSAGENIAMYGSVESAEVGFMNSPGHKANILGDYTRVGIGIVYNQSKGMYYISQWFAK